MLQCKRVYDPPAPTDGARLLVERLWPRGRTKAQVAAEAWLKEVAPSSALRGWFAHRAERWELFRERYRQELARSPVSWRPILDAARRGPVTLLFSARDTERNSAIVLQEFLAQRLRGSRPRHAPPSSARPRRSGGAAAARRGLSADSA